MEKKYDLSCTVLRQAPAFKIIWYIFFTITLQALARFNGIDAGNVHLQVSDP